MPNVSGISASKTTSEMESSLAAGGNWPGPLETAERKFLELRLRTAITESGEEYTGTLKRKR
jgi:hypothetical protein